MGSVKDRVIEAIAGKLGGSALLLINTASGNYGGNENLKLIDDLGADSLDCLEITMEIEDEFGIEIPEEEMAKLQTIGQIVAYIESRPHNGAKTVETTVKTTVETTVDTRPGKQTCLHCGGDIAIRNPTGHCDHLRYPENCPVCMRDIQGQWEDQALAGFKDIAPLIHQENMRQINKWGMQKYDAFTWHAILAEEVGELAKAMLEHKFGSKKTTTEDILKESIQVATLAMKIAEMASLK